MQLMIRRSQKTSGMISKTVKFCADLRAEYTQEERGCINKYGLGGDVIYDSRAAADHREMASSVGPSLRALGHLVLAEMNLTITIASLQQGHHIECKDLGELLECEEAIVQACKGIKGFLEAAETFDGREIVVDLDEEPVAH
jgi:hypothetical protein